VGSDRGREAEGNRKAQGEMMDKVYEVSISITVTAESEEDAKRLALDDLRDPAMEWDTFDIRQVSGHHKRVRSGRCRVCRHYGADCEGY
jgi:hypothetical protein